MGKKFLVGLLVGWAVAILVSPRDVLGFLKPRTA